MEIIDKLIIELKLNPLYRMSQSSMELVHSNVWAWMFDIIEDKQYFFDLFDSKIKYDGHKCYRELNHMDLIFVSEKTYMKKWGKNKGKTVSVLNWNESGLIIENKTKDLAKIDQLNKYKNKISEKTSIKHDFVLATLFKSPEIVGWRVIGYDEILYKLNKNFNKFNSKYMIFLKSYIQMTEQVIELANILMSNNSKKYDFLSYDDNAALLMNLLETIGLRQTYLKYKYAIFAQYLAHKVNEIVGFKEVRIGSNGFEKNLYSFDSEPWLQVDWGISGTTKEGLVDIAVILNKEFRVGIQIQDGKYKKFICRSEKLDSLGIANNLANHGLIFDKERDILQFDVQFKYQYKNKSSDKIEIVNNNKMISKIDFDKIAEEIANDVLIIKNNRNKILKLAGF